MSDKEAVIEMLQALPDTVSMDDILNEVAMLAALRRSEAAADAGKLVPHHLVETRVAGWIKKSVPR